MVVASANPGVQYLNLEKSILCSTGIGFVPPGVHEAETVNAPHQMRRFDFSSQVDAPLSDMSYI